ncbi:unnamed protein product [Sphagnum compactum]
MELVRKVVKKCSNNCVQSASSTHTNDDTAEEIEALDKILKEAMECASPFPDQLIIDGNDYTMREYLNLTYNPDLIHSKNDVKLLIDCGVIHNHLGNDMKALEMWSSLSKNFIITGSSADFHQMKAQIKKHCQSMKVGLEEYMCRLCNSL